MAESDEAEVVVRCARRELPGESVDRIETLVDGDLDWNRTVRLAGTNGVLPLLYHHLSNVDSGGVPDRIHRELGEEYRANLSSNLYRSHELRDVVDRFEQRGIPALPFKGPVLAQDVYGDLSLRWFNDLDILVAKDALPAAVDVLESLGFEWVRDAPRRNDAAVLGGRFTPPICEEYKLLRERDGVLVELRWRIGTEKRPFDLDFDTLWERRRTVSIAGEPMPALGAEDRFLVLAYHGTRHYWERLAWITDIATAVRTYDGGRWSELLGRARRTGTERKLLVGLALAGILLETSLPDAVARRIRADDGITRLASEVCQAFRNDPVRDITATGHADRAYFFLRTCDSASDALTVLLRSAPIHPECDDYERRPLPERLFPLYYLLAPRRALAKAPLVGHVCARSVRSVLDRS